MISTKLASLVAIVPNLVQTYSSESTGSVTTISSVETTTFSDERVLSTPTDSSSLEFTPTEYPYYSTHATSDTKYATPPSRHETSDPLNRASINLILNTKCSTLPSVSDSQKSKRRNSTKSIFNLEVNAPTCQESLTDLESDGQRPEDDPFAGFDYSFDDTGSVSFLSLGESREFRADAPPCIILVTRSDDDEVPYIPLRRQEAYTNLNELYHAHGRWYHSPSRSSSRSSGSEVEKTEESVFLSPDYQSSRFPPLPEDVIHPLATVPVLDYSPNTPYSRGRSPKRKAFVGLSDRLRGFTL